MSKVYYSQVDPRWKNHPYPANAAGYRDKTVGTSGCGPTCAAMVVSSSKETIYPDRMCDISRENGYRVAGGTSDGLYPYVAERWGLEYKRLSSSYETFEYVKQGWMVIIACSSGLWTTGGHFILAVGYRGDEICIYDPYLYSGKFDRSGRQGIVDLEGTSAWVQIDKFKQYSNAQRFHAFKVEGVTPTPTPTPEPGETKIAWVNTSSLNLNVRNAPGGDIIGSLPKGTQVIVYEVQGDWARIGDNKWVSNSYLTYSEPITSRTMYVSTSSANLNVRDSAGGNVIGSLAKGTEVTVIGESDGWSHITSPQNGWVSSQYLSSSKPSSVVGRNTVGQTRTFKTFTYLWSNPDLTGTRYDYKAQTQVVVLQNTSSNVDRVRVVKTGREAYVSISAYTVNDSTGGSTPSPRPSNTVGQTRKLASTTTLYKNSDLTGTKYTYKANTTVKILQNVSSSVDKVYIPATGRVAYVKTNSYR